MSELLQLAERIQMGISIGESHFREFKSALQRNPEGRTEARPVRDVCIDIAEALSAFANADGGELYLGVEDEGVISGVPHPEDKRRLFKDAHRTHIHADTPLPQPVIREITVGGKNVIYFKVLKSEDVVVLTAAGRCLQRFDRQNKPVSAESIQAERQQVKSLSYDRDYVRSAKVSDLDEGLLDNIAQQVAAGFSVEKLLQYLDVAEYTDDGLRLRRAALLLFAKDIVRWHPRCEIRILRVEGKEIEPGKRFNVPDEESIRGNIIELLESSWDRLRPHLARTRYESSVFKESIIYPEEACRETLINAIAHRDYSIEGESTEVAIYDNRMDVRSPGALLSSLSVEDLRKLDRSHQSRNVFIARVLRELGYMREMGEGMKRIFLSVRRKDLIDPELISERRHFTVRLFHRSIFSEKDIQLLEMYGPFSLSPDEQRVVLMGKSGELLSTAGIMKALKIIDTEDFRSLHERLSNKGLLYSEGKVGGQKPNKRLIPRFKIRPANEAIILLAELEAAFRSILPIQRVGKDEIQMISERLNKQSPFRKNLAKCLRQLGFITPENQPSQKAITASLRMPTSMRVTGAQEVIAVVTATGAQGFAFAKDSSGAEYFLHRSAFLEDNDFLSVKVGDEVIFRRAERKILGRPEAAKDIRLTGKKTSQGGVI